MVPAEMECCIGFHLDDQQSVWNSGQHLFAYLLPSDPKVQFQFLAHHIVAGQGFLPPANLEKKYHTH